MNLYKTRKNYRLRVKGIKCHLCNKVIQHGNITNIHENVCRHPKQFFFCSHEHLVEWCYIEGRKKEKELTDCSITI